MSRKLNAFTIGRNTTRAQIMNVDECWIHTPDDEFQHPSSLLAKKGSIHQTEEFLNHPIQLRPGNKTLNLVTTLSLATHHQEKSLKPFTRLQNNSTTLTHRIGAKTEGVAWPDHRGGVEAPEELPEAPLKMAGPGRWFKETGFQRIRRKENARRKEMTAK